MQGTITKALISQKKKEATETKVAVTVWDQGLGCRISPKGKVSWLLKAYLGEGGRGAQQVKYRFGRYPDISIEDARLKAGALRSQIAHGAHLGSERRKERRKQHSVFTSGSLSDALMTYAQLHRTKKGNYWIDLAGSKEDELGGTFKRIVDALGKDTIIGNISKSDIRGLIKAKQAEKKPGAARTLYAALSPFFKWCLSEEYISSNPMDGLKAPGLLQSRERVLTIDEIKAVWTATGKTPYPFGPFYRLCLLTGQRRDEVAGMAYAEIEGDRSEASHGTTSPTWTIPGSRTKNGREHIVHLSPQALAIINEIPRPEGKRLVFRSGRKDKETPISAFSDAKAALDKLLGVPDRSEAPKASKMPPWRLHDLRRTFVTISNDKHLADPHVIEAAVNHLTGVAKAGVAGVYNRAAYLDERRQLFNAWGEYVDSLVTPKLTESVNTELTPRLYVVR